MWITVYSKCNCGISLEFNFDFIDGVTSPEQWNAKDCDCGQRHKATCYCKGDRVIVSTELIEHEENWSEETGFQDVAIAI